MSDVELVIERLPSLPGSGGAILGALLAPEPDLRSVERIVRHDEGLTTAVLRRANSAACGVPGRTFNVSEAVTRLGRRPLIRIALEQQLTETLAGVGRAYGLRRQDAWAGALFGALAAELLAAGEDGVDPGLAFTCALLRDIGKLAVDAMLLPDEAAGLGSGGDERTRSFLELERDRLGADHAEIGAMLARRWELPEEVAAAIAAHHAPAPPDDERHDPLHDVVHAADAMGLWAGMATGHDGLRYPLAEHVQERILRSNRRVESVMAETWERFRELTHQTAAEADAEAGSDAGTGTGTGGGTGAGAGTGTDAATGGSDVRGRNVA